MKRVLNVGGSSRKIAISPRFKGWKMDLLDIDASGSPDIVCDAREMNTLPAGVYDAVYCSHNLEHFAPHDVPKVLRGFLHVLKADGFAEIRVPDFRAAVVTMLSKGHDLEDVYYQSNSSGAVTYRDVFYGHAPHVAKHDYWGHKTAFSTKTMLKALKSAGFKTGIVLEPRPVEIAVAAFVQPPSDEQKAAIGIRARG